MANPVRKYRILVVVVLTVIVTTSMAVVFASSFPIPRFAFGYHESLILTLWTYQNAARMNGSIDAVLQLRNIGLENAGFEYRNSHTIDLFLYSLGGKLVTCWSDGGAFPQVLTNITLKPGEMKQWRINWDSYGENGVTVPGPYLLEGSVLYFSTSRLPILII